MKIILHFSPFNIHLHMILMMTMMKAKFPFVFIWLVESHLEWDQLHSELPFNLPKFHKTLQSLINFSRFQQSFLIFLQSKRCANSHNDFPFAHKKKYISKIFHIISLHFLRITVKWWSISRFFVRWMNWKTFLLWG
jgi:hypothetical protein